ncbi:MAG: hypothetical protein KY055_01435 [Candidatus Nealsonbacteria bacterium]|nr:hypothetical protein [Candidatus Nealsonbacteria bacterium]
MEKGPEIRIVGRASAEKKKQVKKEVEQGFFSQGFFSQAFFRHFESLPPEERKRLEKFEYPKSEKEIALISFANKETSQLMQEAGIEPYNMPVRNFHIVPPELYKKVMGNSETLATSFVTRQGIIFDAQHFRDNPVIFGAALLHELLHLKAHLSMEVQEKGDKVKKTLYRHGLTVGTPQEHKYHKYHQHFTGLHEGIVDEAGKRLFGKLLDCPELAKEKEWLISDEAKEMKKKLAEEKEIPEDDIIWVGKKGEDDLKVFPYPKQRNVLNYICAEIQKHFPDQYQRPDDVYKIFLNAHFTGRLLPVGRLVEKTFGQGSFRLLGNMDVDKQSGVWHLESLKKSRARQMRKTTGS